MVALYAPSDESRDCSATFLLFFAIREKVVRQYTSNGHAIVWSLSDDRRSNARRLFQIFGYTIETLCDKIKQLISTAYVV